MKSIKKYLFVMAVLAVVLGFASCKQDSGPSIVAKFECKTEYDTSVVTFYDDGTFSAAVTESSYGVKNQEFAAGTYVGDPSADEEITVTFTKYPKDEYFVGKEVSYKIRGGKISSMFSAGDEYTRK